MVLHDHQANPHVHLSVRAESKNGRRLNPAQGRSATLARDVRRKATRLGNRRGGLATRRRVASGTATSRYGG
jgi:hypothetical protein